MQFHFNSESEGTVRTQLERILQSPRFREAPRISAFLRYAVEKTLDGRADEVKETLIGMEVYGRGDAFDPQTDSIVRVEASRLRSKLRDYYLNEGSADEIRIELPRGTYVPVFQAERPADSPPAPARPVTGTPKSSRVGVYLGCVLLLAFLAGGAWYLRRVEPAQPAAASAQRLAVLPFQDLSQGHDQEYFCDGLAEEIIDDLSHIPGLSVLARGSSFQFRGPAVDVKEAARRLEVDRVLTGSVRSSGNRVRVTAQLVDPKTGVTLWSSSFDRDSRNALEVQEQISSEVAKALQLVVVGKTRRPVNPEAQNLYLRGRYHYWKSTAEDDALAQQYFQQAVALDPQYAPAYAGLADVLASRPMQGLQVDLSMIESARKAATRALELNPDDIEGLLALAHIARTLDYNWKEAERLYRQAISINPGASRSHNSYGVLLSLAGRFDEATKEFTEALRLDPLSMQIYTNQTLNYYRAGRFEEAIAMARRGSTIDSTYRNLYSPWAASLAEMGRFPEALKAMEAVRERSNDAWTDNHLGLLGHIHARMGDREKALSILRELEQRSQHRYVPRAALADVYLGLGEKDRALVLMQEALTARELLLVGLTVSPHSSSVRNDPRFQAIVARIAIR
jgi:serine/threonine-protein kinase